jgi:CDP-diacylglycerol pyrophosphatase
MAMRLSGEELTENPFKLVASMPGDDVPMGNRTIAVVGAVFPDGPGFIVLEDHAENALAEELQGDHQCGVGGGE